MDTRMTWRSISQCPPRAMGRSRIILCLVVISTVSLEGVAQESEEVAQLRADAAQGDTEAQYNLGMMYVNGQGVTQDEEEAVHLFHMAAEQGNADAQRDLGWMYASGRGVAQDYAEAYAWIGTAAAQRQGGTLDDRRALLGHMTPSQVERGEELAREYREKYVTR